MGAEFREFVAISDLPDEIKAQVLSERDIHKIFKLVFAHVKDKQAFLQQFRNYTGEAYVQKMTQTLLDPAVGTIEKMFISFTIIQTEDTRFASAMIALLEQLIMPRSYDNYDEHIISLHHIVMTDIHLVAGEAAIPHLQSHLWGSDWDNRNTLFEVAFDSLAKIGGQTVLDLFMRLLFTEYRVGEWQMGQRELADALVKTGEPVINPLREMLFAHKEHRVRDRIVQILTRIGTPRALEAVEQWRLRSEHNQSDSDLD